MPNGIYPVPPLHQTSGASRYPPRPTLGQRLKTWGRRDRLDGQLAPGADREASGGKG
jgi:hypothetical protein